MKFRVLWVRSNADSEFKEAIDRYLGRIRHFYPIEVTEVAPERDRKKKTDALIIQAESRRLIEALPAKGTTVVLDERGAAEDSLRFAKWIERMTIQEPQSVTFVMGGDSGLDDRIRERADKLLSLSAMTLPHQVARVVLLEQIYRACTLIRNIPYHK